MRALLGLGVACPWHEVWAAGQWLWDISQLEEELAHVLPSVRLIRSAALFVLSSNAEVNGAEVCPSQGDRGLCPDPAKVRCVAKVKGPEHLCSSAGWF